MFSDGFMSKPMFSDGFIRMDRGTSRLLVTSNLTKSGQSTYSYFF
jgi:hypothetical protein